MDEKFAASLRRTAPSASQRLTESSERSPGTGVQARFRRSWTKAKAGAVLQQSIQVYSKKLIPFRFPRGLAVHVRPQVQIGMALDVLPVALEECPLAAAADVESLRTVRGAHRGGLAPGLQRDRVAGIEAFVPCLAF